MNLILELRTEYEARIVLEMVTQKPTKVDIEWDGEQWILVDTMEEEENSRTVMHEESIASGELDSTHAAFEAAIFKVTAPPTKAFTDDQLNELIKAIAHGFNQPDAEGIVPMSLRNIVSEMAHSMNRHGLVENERVDKFVEILYRELKI